MALSDLQMSINLDTRPVESYRYLIQISMGLGGLRAEYDFQLRAERAFLDEALKLDAAAYYPRDAYLKSITPKRGGSVLLIQDFLEECKRSPMSDENKIRIEVACLVYLANQSSSDKNYRAASEQYLRAYQLRSDANYLYWAAKSAVDGGFTELALSQFDELLKAHPNYLYGYAQRGYLYENNFKNYEKALEDYLKAAELGDSWAQNRVGWWYMTGEYVPLDYDKAEFYLQLASAQSNSTAIANLTHLDKLRKGVSAGKGDVSALNYELKENSDIDPKISKYNLQSYVVLPVEHQVPWLDKRAEEGRGVVTRNADKVERMIGRLGNDCIDRSKIDSALDAQNLSRTGFTNENAQSVGKLINADAVIITTIPAMGFYNAQSIFYEDLDIKAISVSTGKVLWKSLLKGSVLADRDKYIYAAIYDAMETKLYELLESKLKTELNHNPKGPQHSSGQ